MPARRSRRPLVALAVLVALAACSSDDGNSDGAATAGSAASTAGSVPAAAATTTAPGAAVTPDTAVATGPLAGPARVSCGPVTGDQLEPVAGVLRTRVAGIEGAEVGVSAASPGYLLLALPDTVSDDEAIALCALPRVDVRPILQELTADTSGTGAGDDVFDNEFGSRRFRLGPVVADAIAFAPGAIAQEIHGTGWLVATTLTADGTAVWDAALDACFGRTDTCPTGDLAYLVEDRVVVTGTVAAPLGEAPTFALPGTWSEETATRLAALIDLAAEGEFGPAAG